MKSVLALLCLVGFVALSQAQSSTTSAPCVAGTSWFDDCNRCVCNTNGVGLCTKKACPVPGPVNTRSVDEEECSNSEEGSRWRKECNWCRCLGGKASCTRRGCPPAAVFERLAAEQNTPDCEGTVSWKKDCNTCNCANGRAICTTKLCVRREDILAQGDN